jgi:hypothetical protein
MKLYTEEQLRIAIDIALNGINQYYTPIIDRIKPIELPSDEEIEARARGYSDYAHGQAGFIRGTQYMKELILGKEDKTFKQKSKWTEVDNMIRRLK